MRNCFLILVMAGTVSWSAPKQKSSAPGTNKSQSEAFFFRYLLTTHFGLHVVNKSGSMVGGRFALAPIKGSFLYVGPEVNASFFSPGSLIEVLGAGSYEMQILGAPRLFILLGAMGGVAIASDVAGLATVSPAVYGDFGISQEVTGLALVTGRFRPGFVGGNYAFMINLGLTFRFK